MPKSSFEQAKISGIVTCVPSIEKSIDEEIDLFGGSARQVERIKQTIGLNKRRVVAEGTTAADLCERAANELLERSGITKDKIDAVVFVTQTPDHSQPCNAAILHGRLGLKSSCAALDVGLGCSGYVYGLWLAHMMVCNGGCEHVLLLTGDTISRLVNPRDRSVAPLFGDAGSATLVERSDASLASWFSLNTDGQGYKHLIVPAGGARKPSSDATKEAQADAEGNVRSDENLFMDGAEVFNFSIKVEPDSVREIAEFAGVDLDAIDYFVFHQANRYILSNISKRLRIDLEKVPMKTVERYGNQSSSSIPCAMCYELNEALGGSRPSRLVLSGFGVGLSWASALLTVKELAICEIVEYG